MYSIKPFVVAHPVVVWFTQFLNSLSIGILRRSRPQTLSCQSLYVSLQPGNNVTNVTHSKVQMCTMDTCHTCDCIHTHKVVAGPEEAGCSVGLGCIQEVVGDGHKGDLPPVQVLVQHLEENCKGRYIYNTAHSL